MEKKRVMPRGGAQERKSPSSSNLGPRADDEDTEAVGEKRLSKKETRGRKNVRVGRLEWIIERSSPGTLPSCRIPVTTTFWRHPLVSRNVREHHSDRV